MPHSVQERVITIIAEKAVLRRDDVRPEQTLAELGIDSLGMVEAIFAIEEAFDITVPFNANESVQTAFDLSTVASLVAVIEDLIARRPD